MGHETRIDDLLDAWEEAREQGTTISVDELCRNCPELQGELKQKIRQLVEVSNAMSTHHTGDTRNTSP
jgi:hypothetical protein